MNKIVYCIYSFALLAQLVEVSVLETEGCKFESYIGHQFKDCYSNKCTRLVIENAKSNPVEF